jgi:hypothetical protein
MARPANARSGEVSTFQTPCKHRLAVCKRRILGLDVFLLVSSRRTWARALKSRTTRSGPGIAYVISKYICDIIRHCSVHLESLSNIYACLPSLAKYYLHSHTQSTLSRFPYTSIITNTNTNTHLNTLCSNPSALHILPNARPLQLPSDKQPATTTNCWTSSTSRQTVQHKRHNHEASHRRRRSQVLPVRASPHALF